MSVDRAPPFASRWSEAQGFWFYLDRAGPSGIGGWIAPCEPLGDDWIDVQFGGVRLHAPLKRDTDAVGGRALYRFRIPLPFPRRAHVMFGIGGKTLSALVLCRRGAAPLTIPAPQGRWRSVLTTTFAPGRALVVLAPIDWSFRRQRSQQLTQALSRHYAATYYLGPASLQLEGAPFEVDGVALPLLAAAPTCDFAERGLTDEEAEACAEEINALLGEEEPFDVLVQFPSWHAVTKRLPRGRLIYDCIDDHAQLPHISAPLEDNERALAQKAALCVATSETLRSRLTSLGARNVLLAPNAAQPPEPNAWPHHRDAAIAYLGAVEAWFDFALLQAAALAVPEAQVRIIGACSVAPPPGLSKRIRFLGEHDHASALRALQHARVGIIPFQRGALADAVNPVKAYEYLAAGLPVVMTPMGGAELANAPGVTIADSADTFAAAVARAYNETAEAERRAFAKWAESETWAARAAAIIARLNA
jgi:glycosyltransferase involved in cell wall biosynthesis